MKNRYEPKVDEVKEETVVEKPIEKAKTPVKYVITVDNLALRMSPNGEKIGIAPAGINFITEIKDGFGKLADGSGWVMMKYLRKVD